MKKYSLQDCKDKQIAILVNLTKYNLIKSKLKTNWCSLWNQIQHFELFIYPDNTVSYQDGYPPKTYYINRIKEPKALLCIDFEQLSDFYPENKTLFKI